MPQSKKLKSLGCNSNGFEGTWKSKTVSWSEGHPIKLSTNCDFRIYSTSYATCTLSKYCARSTRAVEVSMFANGTNFQTVPIFSMTAILIMYKILMNWLDKNNPKLNALKSYFMWFGFRRKILKKDFSREWNNSKMRVNRLMRLKVTTVTSVALLVRCRLLSLSLWLYTSLQLKYPNNPIQIVHQQFKSYWLLIFGLASVFYPSGSQFLKFSRKLRKIIFKIAWGRWIELFHNSNNFSVYNLPNVCLAVKIRTFLR